MGYASVRRVCLSTPRIQWSVIAALVILIIGFESSAATYYVNNQSASASDSNAGTEALPWLTLSKASAAVAPGDTVIVRPGQYDERVFFYGGNLSSATVPTTFIADPPRQASMWGFDTYRAPHLRITGFDISVPQTLLSSDWTAKYAILVRSDGVHVTNNYIHDCAGAGIHAYWGTPWPSDVIIRDNTLTHVNQGIVIYGFNWLVERNEVTRLVVYDMDCDYIRFFGRDITIRKNYLHGARLSEVGNSHVDAFQTFPNNGWFAEDILIDGNFCESFHQGAMLGVDDYANQTGYIRNLTFTNNVFVGGEIGGSWGILGVHMENLVVRNNLFFGLAYHGVAAGSGTNATVQSNIFYDTGSNYWPDAESTMVGGYNVLNRKPTSPLYENPQDMVADPRLTNLANMVGPDGLPFTDDDGYRLQSNSPAIDFAGGTLVPTDIFGNPRPYGPKADSGSHEYGSEPDDGGGGDVPIEGPTTYYVDDQAASASDNNPGTESQPWKTLSKASASVRPGDTVVVRPGAYSERVKFSGGNLGAATEPTVFIADPPLGASTWGFDTQLAPHLKVMGFEISVPASVISSDPTARYSIFVRSDSVEIANNYIHDSSGVGIHAEWVQPWPIDVIVRDNTITRTSQGIAIYGENWLVERNEISQLVRYDMDVDYMRFFGRNITIRNNVLHGSREVDLAGVPVDAFQTFSNNGWYAEDVTIDANFCQSFNRGAMLGGLDYASQTGYIRNITVTNNVFAGGDIVGTRGVQSAGVSNLAVRNNLFLNLSSTGSGTEIGAGSSATVQNNIFANAGQNYWADSNATMTGGYNLLSSQPSSPLYENAQDLIADPQLVNASNFAGPDGRMFTTDDGYLLQSSSPAIDSAGGVIIATDILGRSRPYSSTGDIGPHESREVDKKALNRRKKFKEFDRGPKDNQLDMTESELAPDEFTAVDTSGDGYLTMDELIEASLGLQANHAQTVWVMFGYTGPETGDETTPFATLDEGIAFVRPGGELRIQGESSELYIGALALTKPVRMSTGLGLTKIGATNGTANEAFVMTSNTEYNNGLETDQTSTGTVEALSDAERAELERRSARSGTTRNSRNDGSDDSTATENGPDSVVYVEPVLPSAVLEGGVRVLTAAQPIAVRVTAPDQIDAATLWAELPHYLRDQVVVDWLSHDTQWRDVWVRVTPNADWASLLAPRDAGVLTISAGTDDQRSETFTFTVLEDVSALDVMGSLPELEHGIGLAYEIVPEEAYDAPVPIEVPVPAGVSAAQVELMYYDYTGARWMPAQQVVGFISDSVIVDGFLLATFNHAGTVQLRVQQ